MTADEVMHTPARSGWFSCRPCGRNTLSVALGHLAGSAAYAAFETPRIVGKNAMPRCSSPFASTPQAGSVVIAGLLQSWMCQFAGNCPGPTAPASADQTSAAAAAAPAVNARIFMSRLLCSVA